MPRYAIRFTQHFDVEADSMTKAKELIVDNPHETEDGKQVYVGWTVSGTYANQPGDGTVIKRSRR